MSTSVTSLVTEAKSVEKKQDKAMKPPSKRKIFYNEMRSKIQEQFPGLKLEQTNQKLYELSQVNTQIFNLPPIFESKTNSFKSLT